MEDECILVSSFLLSLLSVGYTSADVLYRWNSGRSAVAIAEDMKLSQFDLVDCPAGNVTDRVVHSTASVGATVLNNVDDIDGLDRNAKLYVCKYFPIAVGSRQTNGEQIGVYLNVIDVESSISSCVIYHCLVLWLFIRRITTNDGKDVSMLINMTSAVWHAECFLIAVFG